MSVETSAMMSVDFVARCLAGRKSDKAGKGYGIVPNVLHIIPIIKTVDRTEHTIISPDVNADNNLPWVCDHEYLIAGYTTCIIGDRPFNIIGKTSNGVSIAGSRVAALVVTEGGFATPLVFSTDPDEVVTWDGYVGYTAASPITASYVGLTWYCNFYNAGMPVNPPLDSSGHIAATSVVTQQNPNYPTEEQMIAILTAANVRLKGDEI